MTSRARSLSGNCSGSPVGVRRRTFCAIVTVVVVVLLGGCSSAPSERASFEEAAEGLDYGCVESELPSDRFVLLLSCTNTTGSDALLAIFRTDLDRRQEASLVRGDGASVAEGRWIVAGDSESDVEELADAVRG